MSGIQTILSNSIQPLGIPNTGTGTDEGDTWNTAVTRLNAMFVELYAGVTNGGGSSVRAAGNIYATVAQVTSTATNASQTLASFVLPANTLKVANNGILVTAWGTMASNAAPRTVTLNIGGKTLTSGTSTQSGPTWIVSGEYYKIAANSQSALLTGQIGTALTSPSSASDTSVDTGTINVSLTCIDASAAISNIVLNGFTIEYFS